MSEKHTPGPWNLGSPDRNGENAHMCEVMTEYATPNEGGAWPLYDIICCTWSPKYQASSIRLSRQECIANGRLIAAAPELLEALKALADAADSSIELCDEVEAARAAIAKATTP